MPGIAAFAGVHVKPSSDRALIFIYAIILGVILGYLYSDNTPRGKVGATLKDLTVIVILAACLSPFYSI